MFYTFTQNNSGGRWKYDAERGIAPYVIIEAGSAASANERAEEIGLYFDGCESGADCECCGDRWSECGENEATASPEIYVVDVAEYVDLYVFRRPVEYAAYIHYANGSVTALYPVGAGKP
jgi:hypothetical protein